MRHEAKIDWWIALAILAGIIAPLLGATYWVSGSILAAVLLFLFPQSYETTQDGLLLRMGLLRKRIPFDSITFLGPCTDNRSGFALSLDRLLIRYAAGKEFVIAPRDQDAFVADVAMRAPHLTRRGLELVSAL